MLVAVALKANLKYALWQLPGALDRAWLDSRVHQALLRANDFVRRKTKGRAQIIVWDALRAFKTQEHLFAQELDKARVAHPDLDDAELAALVSAYVRPPDLHKPPPHTTGGAVDVTLAWDGDDSLLGEFDDFSERGRPDFFDHQRPTSIVDRMSCILRRLARRAMTKAGFVGIDSEWWHWELGTRHWSQQTGIPAFLDNIQTAPQSEFMSDDCALPSSRRQLVLVTGAAHEFGSSEARVNALGGKSTAHFYARASHHNGRELSEILSHLVGTEGAVLLPSGISAAIAAIAAHADMGDLIAMNGATYYETRTYVRSIGHRTGFAVADFDDTIASERSPRIVFMDHPTNWLLTCPAFPEFETSPDRPPPLRIIDTSVQPLQRLHEAGLTDLIVTSLSKDISLGETTGGAVFGSNQQLEPVRRWVRDHGLLLCPEACATILRNITMLPDRMAIVSDKARAIADFLRSSPLIDEVRQADLSAVGALPGGQISCRFKDPREAVKVEAAIGWQAHLGGAFPLALACTFGAKFTTFEHFGARSTTEVPLVAGTDVIGPEWVRIGVGLEPLAEIIDALKFVFRIAM